MRADCARTVGSRPGGLHMMYSFIARRLAMSVLIVFFVSVFAFSIMHILPGDPARLALGYEASQEAVDELRRQLNLDRPVPVQYFLWIRNVFRGDLGNSIVYRRPINDILRERMPRTMALGLPALALSSGVGISFGIVSAIKRGGWLDNAITFLATVGAGTPVFWIGILSIYIFGLRLRILPIHGYVAPTTDFVLFVRHAILPVFCLAIGMIASVTRQTRNNMLEVINQDFIRTARANGLAEGSVIFRHALRNSLIPVITIIALQVRLVIGGSIIVERIFNIAGVGQLLTASISHRDYFIVQACVLFISLITVLCNLIVDILYGVIDPRIRQSKG